MNLVAEGKSNKEIATELKIEEGTVREYRKGAYVRLGAHNTAQAVRVLLERNGRLVKEDNNT